MIVVAVVGILVTPWATIGASLLVIVRLAVVRRRPAHKRVYRTHL
jgi:hypothetical protein